MTIINRVAQNYVKGVAGSFSQSSPMAELEPMLSVFCRHLNRMAKSITRGEFIALANDIITETPTSDRVKEYQRRICGVVFEEENAENGGHQRLGQKYFYNFMFRHKDILHTTKIDKNCVNRLEWATFPNIQEMYGLVYAEMVLAGVAIKLPSPVSFDRLNNIVEPGDAASFGVQSDVLVTDPSYMVFVNETGSTTNMKKDKTYGKKVIAEQGYSGATPAISTDIRYTTMGFTAATGEPVMCCIIFSSESTKGIPNSWVTGIDKTKIDASFAIPEDEEELIEKVKESGSFAGGGPICKFRGVDVPCFVQYSPHGGITPLILTGCLRRMDELKLFPRVDGKRPFLLLDGHDSRFDLRYLNYIRDEEHPWFCCIGLPYGSHLWQVGDSPAQNGSYKNYEQEFKDTLLRERGIQGLPLAAKPTDIVPTVNYTWNKSYAVVQNNKKAIYERGWYPANKALLNHPDVLRTKKVSDDSNLTVGLDAGMSETMGCAEASRLVINPNHGMAAVLFNAAVNEQRNNPEAMKRKQESYELGLLTKEIDQATRKLTSGVAFCNDMVALHSDNFWDRQNKWMNEKKTKENNKKTTAKKAFWAKKDKCDEIRKRPRETWSINNIQMLLTYKKLKNDIVIKKTRANRDAMLAEYD
jgi:hypothetical protein